MLSPHRQVCARFALLLATIGAWVGGLHTRATAGPPDTERLSAAFLDATQSEIGALLEAKLIRSDNLRWLERDQFGALLEEQSFAAVFEASAFERRVQLGQLLKASLLVCLRQKGDPEMEAAQAGTRELELTVCETKGGLRLLHATAVLDEDLAKAVDVFAALVDQAVAKHAEKIDLLVAVPPFFSEDLTQEYDAHKAIYARLLEEYLMRQPGVLVVEIAEADAIARELQLSESPEHLARGLPHYVIGTYRNEGKGENRKVRVDLGFNHAGKEARHFTSGLLPAKEVAPTLRAEVAKYVGTLRDGAIVKADPVVEAAQLMERAESFKRIGDWNEWAVLVESALLLSPSDFDIRCEAVQVNLTRFEQHFDKRDADEQDARLALQFYRRAGDLYESVLQEDLSRAPEERSPYLLGHELRGPVYWHAHIKTPPHKLFAEVQNETRERLLRIVRWRAQAGRRNAAEYFSTAIQGLPYDQQYDIFTNAIVSLQDLPDARKRTIAMTRHSYYAGNMDNPEGLQFIERLIKSENAEVQAAGRYLLDEVEELRRLSNKPPAESATEPKGEPSRILVEPLELTIALEDRPALDRTGSVVYDAAGVWRSRPKGCIPAGEFGDLVWGPQLFLMKQKGELTVLWKPDQLNVWVKDVCFDGRFVWLAVEPRLSEPYLLVIDPRTRHSRRIDRSAGLPMPEGFVAPGSGVFTKSFSLAAIEPGMLCVAGTFGRTWIAIVSADPAGAANVKIIHEAREVLELMDDEAWRSSKYQFNPKWSHTFSSEVNGTVVRRVILARGGAGGGGGWLMGHPLVIDPDSGSVGVIQGRIWDVAMPAVQWHDYSESALFQVSRVQMRGIPALVRLGFPTFEPEPILRSVPEGTVAITPGRIHIVGAKWWSARFDGSKVLDKKLTLLEEELPWNDKASNRLPEIFHSVHYGLIVNGEYAARELTKQAD